MGRFADEVQESVHALKGIGQQQVMGLHLRRDGCVQADAMRYAGLERRVGQSAALILAQPVGQ